MVTGCMVKGCRDMVKGLVKGRRDIYGDAPSGEGL
jgi:hypothetical protein